MRWLDVMLVLTIWPLASILVVGNKVYFTHESVTVTKCSRCCSCSADDDDDSAGMNRTHDIAIFLSVTSDLILIRRDYQSMYLISLLVESCVMQHALWNMCIIHIAMLFRLLLICFARNVFFSFRHAFSTKVPRPIAVKLRHMIGNWLNFIIQMPSSKIWGPPPQKKSGSKTCKISVDFIQPPTLIANISGTAQDI